MKLLIFSILQLCSVSVIFAQTFYSNGAQLFISDGALVHVNGGVDLDQTTSLTNQGSLTTTKNATSSMPGSFRIGSNAGVSGSGQYFVEQDWINNGSFEADLSTVTLFGNTQQLITSDNNVNTEFNHLTLTGTGTGNDRKKSLFNVSASTAVTGVLTLNSRELETQENSFSVLNPDVNAVVYSTTFGNEGFVSSVQNGYFRRMTNSAAVYVFPTGSSAGTLRFRPIEITPTNAQAGEYGVRLNNYDANNDGFDRTKLSEELCDVNELFYHSIERLLGDDSCKIRMFFLPASDGDWNGIGHWNTGPDLWNNISTSGPVAGTYSTIDSDNWKFIPEDHPFILSKPKPGPPDLNCPVACQNSTTTVFTVNGGSGNFQWSFPSSATVLSGDGTNAVTVNWGNSSGQVTVVDLGNDGCPSLPANCIPTFYPVPVVDFTYVSEGATFFFTDQTSGAIAWDWDFGDGADAFIQNPAHTFDENGDVYLVTLNIIDANGCTGQGTKQVELFHDIVVPNIITPNNDGTNDVFYIKTSGIKEYDLVIVNRWGNVVFTSNSPTLVWDGKYKGEYVEDGVYFYKLRVTSSNKEYQYHGNVTVIKN